MKKHNELQNSQLCEFCRFCWFCQLCRFCHFCRFCCTQTQTPTATRPHAHGHTQDRQHKGNSAAKEDCSVILRWSDRTQSVTGRARPRMGRSTLRPQRIVTYFLGRSKGTSNCCWERDCNPSFPPPTSPLPISNWNWENCTSSGSGTGTGFLPISGNCKDVRFHAILNVGHFWAPSLVTLLTFQNVINPEHPKP